MKFRIMLYVMYQSLQGISQLVVLFNVFQIYYFIVRLVKVSQHNRLVELFWVLIRLEIESMNQQVTFYPILIK